jgi:proline iminopeptidase
MKQRITFLLFVCLWIASGHAIACNCADTFSFEEEFEKSEKIFSGTVIEIVSAKEEFWPPWMQNTYTRITILVDQYWKGRVREKETIEWHSYCRWYLKEGQEMLFFVNSGFPHDRAGCGLSDRLDKSKEIIKKLGDGSKAFSRDWTIWYFGVLLLVLITGGTMKRKTRFISMAIGVVLLMVVCAAFLFWQHIKKPLYVPGNLSSEMDITVPVQEKDSEYWDMGNGINIYHFSEGSGRNVLIIHGGPGYPYRTPWTGLQSMTDRYQFHYYDQRGSGKSSRPVKGFSSGNFFKNVAELNRTLGMGTQLADIERIRQILKEDKLILIGHSFGGFIAALYASEFPEHVAGMVLISPAGGLVTPRDTIDMAETVKPTLSEEEKQAFDLFMEDYLDFRHIFSKTEEDMEAAGLKLAGFSGLLEDPDNPEKKQPITLEARPGGWMVFGIYFGMGIEHDYSQALGVVEAPVLVLHGAQDFINIDIIKPYADSLPNAQLKIVDDAGHVMFEETPEEFSRIVESFLSGLE